MIVTVVVNDVALIVAVVVVADTGVVQGAHQQLVRSRMSRVTNLSFPHALTGSPLLTSSVLGQGLPMKH